jgi:hypothetical protein
MFSWIFGSSATTPNDTESGKQSEFEKQSAFENQTESEHVIINDHPVTPRFRVIYNEENYKNIQGKLNRLPFKFNPGKLWLMLCCNDYNIMCFFITDMDYQFINYFKKLAEDKKDYFYNEECDFNDMVENMYMTDNPTKFESFIHLFEVGNELYKGMAHSGKGLADVLSEFYCDNKEMDREYKRCIDLCDEIYKNIYEINGKCSFSM